MPNLDLYVLHTFSEDGEVKYLVTTDLAAATRFLLRVVCVDDDAARTRGQGSGSDKDGEESESDPEGRKDMEIPDWVIESVRDYLNEDKWPRYAGILKYCIERGVSPDMLESLFPGRGEMISQSQPNPVENFLSLKLYNRESAWLLCFLFYVSGVTMTGNELVAMSQILMDVGDGPSYPHVLASREMSGSFEV